MQEKCPVLSRIYQHEERTLLNSVNLFVRTYVKQSLFRP